MNNAKIKAIKNAAKLGDDCFSYILGEIREGVSEISLAEKIENFLLSNGGEGLAFPTICVSGVRSNQPHGEPSSKLIEKGDFLTMDFGAIVDGYCGDMTRTVVIGQPSSKQREVYALVLEAQIKALEAIKPGKKCKDIDAIARDIIKEAGYGEYFVHGIGHGVGKEVHEDPRINATSEDFCELGSLVTVEPGIYIPDEFGVRIEDLVLIVEDGIINLVNSKKELIVI